MDATTLDILRDLIDASIHARGHLTRLAETSGIREQLNTAIAAAETHCDQLELRDPAEIMQSVVNRLWDDLMLLKARIQMPGVEDSGYPFLDREQAYYIAAGLRDDLQER